MAAPYDVNTSECFLIPPVDDNEFRSSPAPWYLFRFEGMMDPEHDISLWKEEARNIIFLNLDPFSWRYNDSGVERPHARVSRLYVAFAPRKDNDDGGDSASIRFLVSNVSHSLRDAIKHRFLSALKLPESSSLQDTSCPATVSELEEHWKLLSDPIPAGDHAEATVQHTPKTTTLLRRFQDFNFWNMKHVDSGDPPTDETMVARTVFLKLVYAARREGPSSNDAKHFIDECLDQYLRKGSKNTAFLKQPLYCNKWTVQFVMGGVAEDVSAALANCLSHNADVEDVLMLHVSLERTPRRHWIEGEVWKARRGSRQQQPDPHKHNDILGKPPQPTVPREGPASEEEEETPA